MDVVREEEKTEASIVSESLSSGAEVVEEAEEEGKDCSLDVVEVRIEFVAESGEWNSSSEVGSLSVSSTRIGGEGLERSFKKIVWIE